jgi:hypothetical protein
LRFSPEMVASEPDRCLRAIQAEVDRRGGIQNPARSRPRSQQDRKDTGT